MQRLIPGDEVLCVADGRSDLARHAWTSLDFDLPGVFLQYGRHPHWDWGHGIRNRFMRAATADYLLHMDDDDFYFPGAFDLIRTGIVAGEGRVHLFRCLNNDGTVGKFRPKRPAMHGEVGTCMVCHPNKQETFGEWGSYYGGDSGFIISTIRKTGLPVMWHPAVTVSRGLTVDVPDGLGVDWPEGGTLVP
jgi:hypothetical protein